MPPRPPSRTTLSFPEVLPMVDATVPAARCHPVLRQHELRRVRLPVGAGVLPVVVPDSGEWLRCGIGGSLAGRSAVWEPPYWLQIWPAAIAIAQTLGTLALRGLRVLDLGCGLGVPGIAAAWRGAHVTFVDRSPDAVEFARWNAGRVGSPAAVDVQCLDWAERIVQGTFDLVLLSDVSYRALHHDPLRRQLAACLAPHGAVLHADPRRPEATPFVRWLEAEFTSVTGRRDVQHRGRRIEVRLCLAADPVVGLDPWRLLGARVMRATGGAGG